MPVYISISIAIFIWSLFPLGVTIGLKSMTTIEFIFFVYMIACAGSLIIGIGYMAVKGSLARAWAIQKTIDLRGYVMVLVSGILGVLCHAFFFIALSLANKGGVSLLYESWPVLAIIATPFLMRKVWKRVSMTEILVSFAALGGVATIILSDPNVDMGTHNNDSLLTIGGYILAFAGAYMCALTAVSKGAYSEYFEGLNDGFAASMASEMFSRIICLIVVIFIFFAFDLQVNMATIDWGSTVFVGFIVLVLGGAFYTYALISSTSPTIHVMNYFVPVLAVIWLWLMRESDINAGLFIGGAIVLVSNIYLVLAARKAEFEEAL